MSIAVIKYPGTQCDQESLRACKEFDPDTELVYHEDLQAAYDAYFVPGGWSYGDHLRSGIIAANTESMLILKHEAERGKKILGICNGFQILCEAGLLPGALLRNEQLRFNCKWVQIEINKNISYLSDLEKRKLKIPIAHGEGRFIHENPKELFEKKQVVATYVENPNGSFENIAGVCNEKGNVVGMMPHPERAVKLILSSIDGLEIIKRFATKKR